MLESDNREARTESLRVAHVGKYDPDSAIGPQKAIAGILRNLPRHGVDVELWQFGRRAQEVSWKELDGIPVLDLPIRRRHASFLMGLPKQTEEALRERTRHVDLVHFHSVFVPENVHTGSLLRVPYVISPRGQYTTLVFHGRNRLAKKIWLAMRERRYISSARALHAVSDREASELKELVPKGRIFSVPNGMDQQVLDRPVKAPAGKTLLFLGRLSVQHKGIDRLLAGYSEFLKRSGDKSSDLIVAGPDFKGDKQRIEEQIQALGLQDRVSLPGGVFGDDKWALIDRAYAFVLTSRWEGMPFALLEALTAARPVLVTPETNMGAIIDEYEAGFQVAGDTDAIAAGIGSLLTLPSEEYVRMQHQARRLIQDEFTWERVVGDLAMRYRDMVATG